MSFKPIGTLAIAVLMATAASGVYAVSSADEPPTPSVTAEPTPNAGDTEKPAANQADEPAVTQEVVRDSKSPKVVDGQIVLQGFNTALASDLIGSTVFSYHEEAIGQVSDVIINLDGSVDGVVIGVGGFLGIGEKRVAVNMETLSVAPEPNGRVRLVLNASQEDLDAAPEFKTSAQQMFELEVETETRARELERQNEDADEPSGTKE